MHVCNLWCAYYRMPILYNNITGGRFLCALFFLCLTLASLSSIVAMVEKSVRVLIDYGSEYNYMYSNYPKLTALLEYLHCRCDLQLYADKILSLKCSQAIVTVLTIHCMYQLKHCHECNVEKWHEKSGCETNIAFG